MAGVRNLPMGEQAAQTTTLVSEKAALAVAYKLLIAARSAGGVSTAASWSPTCSGPK
jgi:hypothetical protein